MPVRRDTATKPHPLNSQILHQLACPVCFGALQLISSAAQIECRECRRLYPLIDGIPVLIAERAVKLRSE
jgi:uncharacterized protein